MSKFTYDDIVVVGDSAPAELRPGARAWVIAVFENRASRPGKQFDAFPDGSVYTIEFEDGAAIDIHEDNLVLEKQDDGSE